MSWTVGGNTFPQNCYVVTVTLSFRKSTWYDLGNKLLRYRKNVFGLTSGRIINILIVATIYIYMEEDISMCTRWYAHVVIYTYSVVTWRKSQNCFIFISTSATIWELQVSMFSVHRRRIRTRDHLQNDASRQQLRWQDRKRQGRITAVPLYISTIRLMKALVMSVFLSARSWAWNKSTSRGIEMLSKDPACLTPGPMLPTVEVMQLRSFLGYHLQLFEKENYFL